MNQKPASKKSMSRLQTRFRSQQSAIPPIDKATGGDKQDKALVVTEAPESDTNLRQRRRYPIFAN